MISADKLTHVGGKRWGLNVCNSQLEIKSHLQKNLSILEVSGFKRACKSVTERDMPQGTNCCRETQAHTITAHVLAWHHTGVMAPQERQEMGICLPFYYNLKNKLKSSFHLICIKLKVQK